MGNTIQTVALSDFPIGILFLQLFGRLEPEGCSPCKDGLDGFQIVPVAESLVLCHCNDDRRNLTGNQQHVSSPCSRVSFMTYQVQIVYTELLNRLKEPIDLEFGKVDDLITAIGM